MKKTPFKPFKVAAVSRNTNCFGLRGMVIMAADGEAYEVGANSLNARLKGSTLKVPIVGRNGRGFSRLGFEIPRRLPTAPAGVLREVWGTTGDRS